MTKRSAKKPAWTYDPRLRELLVALLAMVKKVNRPYVIGGALAMSAQGYSRHTNDLDVFLLRRDARSWLAAAHAVGLKTDEVFHGLHYMAWLPKHGDPLIRIDLMFPSEDVYISGIRTPTKGDVSGIPAKVMSIEFLAAVKFTSDREKDALDFDAMFKRGLFEPETVAYILNAVGDKDAARGVLKRCKALEAKMNGHVPRRK
jgi:hypothetical protein